MDFGQISLVIVVAALSGMVARAFKQPMLIGYLFAGFILVNFGFVQDTSDLTSLAEIGVTLLLFLVGLEMNLDELPFIGKVAVLTGLGQIVFTFSIGLILSLLLGYPPVPSFYIAAALTFSSTIIAVKLLGERGDLDSLFGKISIGFLLVQDFVVIVVLIFLSSLGSESTSGIDYMFLAFKAAVLFGLIYFLSKKVFPLVYHKIAGHSDELLFIVSIAWALGLASFVGGPLGFSLEIGGFLAGIALSGLPEHLSVASKTRPLRDFFLLIFFVILGTNLVVGGIPAIIFPALVFSIFVLIGNPLIVVALMGLLGYKSRTSFMSSVTVAQVSEFSFILMAIGLSLDHVSETHVSTVVLVGVITMTASTYMITKADYLFDRLSPLLLFFERKNASAGVYMKNEKPVGHIVLVGAGRTGRALMSVFKKRRQSFVVVDFNPIVVRKLIDKSVSTVFGDINDEAVMEAVNLEKARYLIMTTSDLHDSLVVLSHLKQFGSSSPLVIAKSQNARDASLLYRSGATYVLVPEMIAGDHMRHLFSVYGFAESKIMKLGKGHYKRLLRTL